MNFAQHLCSIDTIFGELQELNGTKYLLHSKRSGEKNKLFWRATKLNHNICMLEKGLWRLNCTNFHKFWMVDLTEEDVSQHVSLNFLDLVVVTYFQMNSIGIDVVNYMECFREAVTE